MRIVAFGVDFFPKLIITMIKYKKAIVFEVWS